METGSPPSWVQEASLAGRNLISSALLMVDQALCPKGFYWWSAASLPSGTMVATRACRLGSAAGTVLRDITALNSLSTQFPALTGTGATETRPYFALQGGMVLLAQKCLPHRASPT